jgi:hypothetical protein
MLDAEKRMHEVLEAQTLASLAVRTVAKAPRSYHSDIVNWIGNRSASRRDELDAG